MSMNLSTATAYAEKLVTWLNPFCERIAIAGSVRRLRNTCNDIDLVVIPRFGAAPADLFGNASGAPRANPLHAHLVNYVRDQSAALPNSVKWQTGETNPEGTNFILQLPKCQLDIYVATETNWGSKLVQRTGSKEHNVWLATRARDLGLRWELDSGLTSPTRPTIGQTEEAIYSALSLNFIPPPDREPGRLERYIL